jgi:hypothetical protein
VPICNEANPKPRKDGVMQRRLNIDFTPFFDQKMAQPYIRLTHSLNLAMLHDLGFSLVYSMRRERIDLCLNIISFDKVRNIPYNYF